MVSMNAVAVINVIYINPADPYPVVRTFASAESLRRHADDEHEQNPGGDWLSWQTLAGLAESGADTGRAGNYWLRRTQVI